MSTTTNVIINSFYKVGVEKNLVDHVWGPEQPERPENAIVPLELEFCGLSWEEKIANVRIEV